MSVLQKASDLIDCLGRAGEPMTLGEVRDALDMPKSSTHRLLTELAGLGIVRRTQDGLYALGPRLLYWGEAASNGYDLRRIAEQPMRRLRDELDESVHLYVRERDVRICIAAAEGRQVLRPFVELGRPLPLRVGAAGKLLLAFADEKTQQLEIERAAGEATGSHKPIDAEQLEEIRTERWATSVGEREPGVSAAATTVFDGRGRVVAALCISAPTVRLPEERFADLRPALETCAAEISSLLGRNTGEYA